MGTRTVQPLMRPPRTTVSIPPSKSVTHRALVAAALADGESFVAPALRSDDTEATAAGLAALGVSVEPRGAGWVVTGRGGRVPGGGRLDLRESGTSMRLLTAVAALGGRPSTLDGAPRLRERPVAPLAAALEELGGTVRLEGPAGGLPLRAGGRRPAGGRVVVPGDDSSQYASALLAIGAVLRDGLVVEIAPPAVSLPYVEVTAAVLRQFGARVERTGERAWRVAPGGLTGRGYAVEGDHSTASYFLAAAAIAGGRIRVEGVRPDSPQPDRRFGELLERAGGCVVRRGDAFVEATGSGPPGGFDVDLADAPDIAPTVAVVAAFARGPSILRGLGHLRLKESDRLAVVAENLRALGREARVEGDSLAIAASGGPLRPATVRTCGDHRMAMAFALVGLRVPGVVIDDADCVGKSDPAFWDRLDALAGPAALD